MTEPVADHAAGYPAAYPATDPAADPAAPMTDRRRQLRAAGLVAGVLVVLGAVLGPVWAAWSPPGPIGIQLTGGVQPDETEAWAAGDGRYALIAIVVGLLAAVAAWCVPVLRQARGPLVVLGLAVGGIAGALLTDVVGAAVRGDGSDYTCGAGTCIQHLPLAVHMHGLWYLEGFVAVLVYGLFVSFAVSDDLGRPDPARAEHLRARDRDRDREPVSVGPQDHPQDGGGHGDAAGVP